MINKNNHQNSNYIDNNNNYINSSNNNYLNRNTTKYANNVNNNDIIIANNSSNSKIFYPNNSINNNGNNINNMVSQHIPTIHNNDTFDYRDNRNNKIWCIFPYGMEIKTKLIKAISSSMRKHLNNKKKYHGLFYSKTIRFGY